MAVRDKLRTEFNVTHTAVDIRITGQPPPICGDWFLAVHPGPFRSTQQESLREEYDLDITLSLRRQYVPNDRVGSYVVAEDPNGIYAKAERVRALLHMQEDYRVAANVIIGAVSGFSIPLKFASCSKPQPVTADWFGGEEGDGGYTITLSFHKALREQDIPYQT